jgi:hypothetical protein
MMVDPALETEWTASISVDPSPMRLHDDEKLIIRRWWLYSANRPERV